MFLRTIPGVLKPVLIFVCLTPALTGCYTPLPKKNTQVATDWSEPGAPTNHVPVTQSVIRPAVAPAPTMPAPAPVPADAMWISLSRWAAEQGLTTPWRVAAAPTNTFAIVSPRGIIALQAGSTTALWNGMELRLGFKPQAVASLTNLMVHTLDLQKNLAPLLTGRSATNSGRVLVLDAGHGGGNLGTCSAGGGGCEKSFTLDWALRTAQLLETNGWTVYLTRTNDVEVSLPARVEFAEEVQADVFVSLHFNHSGGGPDPAGVETYCLTPVGMESTLTRGYPDDPAEVLPNNAFDTENLRLAVRVHKELLAIAGMRDRGIRRARFQTVLRGQNRPAILIEGGFLSNAAEARRVADPDYRQKLAEAVARAFAP